MSRERIEREAAGVLRDHVLLDSDREIAFDAPLGPSVGLDSLGLMEFLAALEERFDLDFPYSLWTDRREFTLARLVDHIHATRPDGDPVTPSGVDAASPDPRGAAG